LCDRKIVIAGAAYMNNRGKKKVPARHFAVTATAKTPQLKPL
jgi:hypothetical protein